MVDWLVDGKDEDPEGREDTANLAKDALMALSCAAAVGFLAARVSGLVATP